MSTAKNVVAEPLAMLSGGQAIGCALCKPNVSLSVPVVKL